MTNNFDTVREALKTADTGVLRGTIINVAITEALTALAQIEADHFTSHDMASASAQGYRAGVASVQQGTAPCASCDGTGSGGMGLGCTDCLGTGQDPSTAAPVAQQQEPVALLWQVRRALARACAICDAVPSREPGHLGKLVNAQDDGTHGYREIHDAEAALVAYLTTPEAAPAAQQPQEETVGWLDPETDTMYTLKELVGFDTDGLVALCRAAPVAQQQAEAVPDLLRIIEQYEKHGVTCQTYRHFVTAPCAECNAAPQQAEAVPLLSEAEVDDILIACLQIPNPRRRIRAVEQAVRAKLGKEGA